MVGQITQDRRSGREGRGSGPGRMLCNALVEGRGVGSLLTVLSIAAPTTHAATLDARLLLPEQLQNLRVLNQLWVGSSCVLLEIYAVR